MNRILAALPPAEQAFVADRSRCVTLRAGEIVIGHGEPISIVFFPHSGVVSLVSLLTTGESFALATIGREGAIGSVIALDIRQSPPWSAAIVQLDSEGALISSDAFLELLDCLPEFRKGTLGYAGRLMTDIARTAVCNRFHSHDQRLARWLSELQHKSGERVFPLTHDALAQLLGGSRSPFTSALGELRDAGVIAYSRGRIEILDEQRLTASACECCQRA